MCSHYSGLIFPSYMIMTFFIYSCPLPFASCTPSPSKQWGGGGEGRSVHSHSQVRPVAVGYTHSSAGRDCHCLSSSHPTSPPSSATFAKGSASSNLSGIEVQAVVAQKVTISSAELSIVDREQKSSRKGKQ